MDDKKDTKYPTILKIFKTMTYNDDEEDVSEAIEWLKTKANTFFAYLDKPTEVRVGEVFELKYSYKEDSLCKIHIPDAATVENVLKKSGEAKNKWIELSPTKRAELIQKLGCEIQKKQNLIAQLEIVARGILSKDTKKAPFALLTDYLWFYSSYSTKYGSDDASRKPEGLLVAVISDKNCLSSLGYILGSALAHGDKIVLQPGPQLTLITSLLIDIAVEVGVPEGTIRLIPGAVDSSIFFTAPQVSIILIFDDIHKEKYLFGNHFGKKCLHFHSSGIPMLVFDNCDLDSACQSAVDAAWGYKGMLPWSVRTILVQESIFGSFTQKLKRRIDKTLIGNGNKKNIDISYPDATVLQKVANLVEKAKSGGVEVHQPNPNNPVPVLLIGGNIFTNNVIKEDTIDVPVVTVTAFRTINEAVALANNTRQGLAASVWTESTSLAHEVVRKLKVANVWINSHGLFAPEIPVAPYKSSGNGRFGGKNGLEEYTRSKTPKREAFSQAPKGNVMEKAITEAKKAQESWNKLTKLERTKHSQAVVRNITTNRTAWNLPDKWLDDWITSIYDSVIVNRSEDGFYTQKKFNVISIKEPRGVVAIETLEDVTTHNKKLVTAALMEGNAVIILNDSKEATALYTSMSTMLPKGVLSVLPCSQNTTNVAALHKELDVYFGEKNNNVFWSLPLKSSSKFKVVNSDNWDEVYRSVTLIKNAWFNVGQSFL